MAREREERAFPCGNGTSRVCVLLRCLQEEENITRTPGEEQHHLCRAQSREPHSHKTRKGAPTGDGQDVGGNKQEGAA